MLDRSDALDRAFHALSDPSRRQMIDRLAQAPASVSELARPLQMTLAAVVQHVQVLESSGLIESRKTGRVRKCSIDQGMLSATEQWLTDPSHRLAAPPRPARRGPGRAGTPGQDTARDTEARTT